MLGRLLQGLAAHSAARRAQLAGVAALHASCSAPSPPSPAPPHPEPTSQPPLRQVSTAYKCAVILRDLIAPYLLRRRKADVRAQLPAKTEQARGVWLSFGVCGARVLRPALLCWAC